MSKLIEKLTPPNTKEVRPGIFIQKYKDGYRVVKPLAWNGKFRTKEQLKTVFNFKTIATIVLILFIAWSYQKETTYCTQLRDNPCDLLPDITEYCFDEYASPLPDKDLIPSLPQQKNLIDILYEN